MQDVPDVQDITMEDEDDLLVLNPSIDPSEPSTNHTISEKQTTMEREKIHKRRKRTNGGESTDGHDKSDPITIFRQRTLVGSNLLEERVNKTINQRADSGHLVVNRIHQTLYQQTVNMVKNRGWLLHPCNERLYQDSELFLRLCPSPSMLHNIFLLCLEPNSKRFTVVLYIAAELSASQIRSLVKDAKYTYGTRHLLLIQDGKTNARVERELARLNQSGGSRRSVEAMEVTAILYPVYSQPPPRTTVDPTTAKASRRGTRQYRDGNSPSLSDIHSLPKMSSQDPVAKYLGKSPNDVLPVQRASNPFITLWRRVQPTTQ